MTFYNQMVPDTPDLPTTVRPAHGSMEAVHARAAEAPTQLEPTQTPAPALRTITVAGVQLEVDPTVFDDFELLESLAEIQRGDILALPTVFRAVAGDQAQALLDAVRDDRGRVTATAATELLVQIMRELAPKA